MTLRKIIFYICLFVSTILSITGFIQINMWLWVIAVLIVGGFWIIARKKMSALCLIFSIIIAVAGILLKISVFYMLIYSLFSIICWDLTLLDLSLLKNASDKKALFYQSLRIRSLGISSVTGLIIIIIGQLLNFKINLLIMIILVILIFFLIDQIIRILYKEK